MRELEWEIGYKGGSINSPSSALTALGVVDSLLYKDSFERDIEGATGLKAGTDPRYTDSGEGTLM